MLHKHKHDERCDGNRSGNAAYEDSRPAANKPSELHSSNGTVRAWLSSYLLPEITVLEGQWPFSIVPTCQPAENTLFVIDMGPITSEFPPPMP